MNTRKVERIEPSSKDKQSNLNFGNNKNKHLENPNYGEIQKSANEDLDTKMNEEEKEKNKVKSNQKSPSELFRQTYNTKIKQFKNINSVNNNTKKSNSENER